MRALRWILLALVLALVALAGLAAVVRLADGPVAVFPGGALERGELVREPPEDWSFVQHVAEIELQLLEPPRSRTTWIVLHEGIPYIGAGFLNVPLWKQWPHEALRDGRGILRIAGRRFPVRLERVTDPAVTGPVATRVAEKYGLGSGSGPPDPEETWIFRVASRPPD